jgi:hypothetical protein
MAQKRVDVVLACQDEATKVFNNLSQGTLPALVKHLGGLAAGALSAGAAIGFITDSFREFAESEKVTRKLEGALRDAGLTVEAHAGHLDKMASALARVSTRDDDVIKQAQTLLISLGGLAGDGLDRSTEAALNLSAALGKDLNEAAEMIAKAANGSTTAFGKLGFKFREGASDAEKFNAVLEQIQAKFGTAAAAEVDTLSGSVTQLGKAWIDVKKAAGEALASQTSATSNLQGLAKFLEVVSKAGLGPAIAGVTGNRGTSLDNELRIAEKIADESEAARLGISTAELASRRAEEAAQLRHKAESEAFWKDEEERAKKAAEEFSKVVKRLVTDINYGAPIDLVNRRRELPLTGLSPDVFSAGFDQPAPFPRTAGQAMSVAGAPDFAQIAIEGLDAASAWEAANAQFGESKEKMAAVAEALMPVLERMQTLKMETPEVTAALLEMKDALALQETLDAAEAATLAFADTFVQVAGAFAEGTLTIEGAFKAMIKGMLNAMSREMLVKAAREIAEAFATWPAGTATHLKSAALYTAGAGLASASAGAFASGGIVGRHGALQRFAGGGMVRPAPGFDSVPAMLTPGEMVLTKRATDSVLGGRAVLASPDAARGSGAPATVHNWTVYTLDSADFEAYLERNPRALRAGLDNMQRKGV